MGARSRPAVGVASDRTPGFTPEKIFRLVMKAIQLFGPSGGATASQITTYIMTAHRVSLTSKDLKLGVKDALKKGIQAGVLRRRPVDGKYYVCPRTASINPNRLPITKILRRVAPPQQPLSLQHMRRGRLAIPDFTRNRQTKGRSDGTMLPRTPRMMNKPPGARQPKDTVTFQPMKRAIVHTPLPGQKRMRNHLTPMHPDPRGRMKDRFRGELKKEGLGQNRFNRDPKKPGNDAGQEKGKRGRPRRASLPHQPNAQPANGANANSNANTTRTRSPVKSPTKMDKQKKADETGAQSNVENNNQNGGEKAKPKN